MNLMEELGTTYKQLMKNNQKRVDLANNLLKESDAFKRELAMIALFKIFEDELRENVFWKMIRKNHINEINTLIINDVEEIQIDYNIRVITIVKEEYKRSGRIHWKRNNDLITYLLNHKKDDFNLPFSAMLYAFQNQREWQEKILMSKFKNFDAIFHFNEEGINQTEFVKRMKEIQHMRNLSVHEAIPCGVTEVISGIESAIYLLKKLHSQIK